MPSYSFTRLNLYRRCPHMLRCYLDKVPAPENELLQAGSLAHLFYERYAQHCLEGGEGTDIDAAEGIARAAYEEMRSKGKPFLDEDQFEQVYTDLIVPFLDTHVIPTDRQIRVEERMCIGPQGQGLDWFDGAAWFRGILDAIEKAGDDGVRVIDYKTGHDTTVNELQGQVYAWLLFTAYPSISDIEVVFDFTRFNVQKSFAYCRDDDFGWLDQRIRGQIERIEADTDMTPTPGQACEWCPYTEACTMAVPQAPGRITTDEEARNAVETIALLERDVKTQKGALRAWCTEHGHVVHNGKDWGHHAVGGMGFPDAETFYEAAKRDGVEHPFAFLSVSGTKVKKLMRDGAYQGCLGGIAENERSTRFMGRKADANHND